MAIFPIPVWIPNIGKRRLHGAKMLLCASACWNFALFANPFNSRSAVFVWVNEQAPDELL